MTGPTHGRELVRYTVSGAGPIRPAPPAAKLGRMIETMVLVPSTALGFLLSPVGFTMLYAWSFLTLSSVELTTRLIMRYSLRQTALGALAVTVSTVVVGLAFLAWTDLALGAGGASWGQVLSRRLTWLPLAMAVLAVANLVVARRVLRMNPRRSAITAVAMGVLSAPWPVLVLP